MSKIALAAGIVCILLGGFWLLQGLGLVHVRPILCIADCAPVEGSSRSWAIIGLLALMAGAAMIVYFFKRRARP